MRISETRYDRDRLRFGVALRFLQHNARTETIRVWTGVTADRVRNLYRTYLVPVGAPSRMRGKSPGKTSFFLASSKRRHETVWLASLFALLGVIPSNSGAAIGDRRPNPIRGTRMCQAYEMYSALVPSPEIPFEYAVFLANTLTAGHEMRLGACCDCGSLLVVDRLLRPSKRCHHCEGGPT
jgi:hypothetical protein